MTAVYLANVTGDGASTASAQRPDVAAGTRLACLMVHEARRRAVIVAPSDTLAGAGITRLLAGTTLADLRAKARSTGPTGAQRTAMASWLAANGYAALPASAVTWWDYIHHIARQVNPAGDLDLTGVA